MVGAIIVPPPPWPITFHEPDRGACPHMGTAKAARRNNVTTWICLKEKLRSRIRTKGFEQRIKAKPIKRED
jgi:hypothetical protein